MRGALALRVPIQTASINMASTPVTTSAYTTLVASLTNGVSAMELFNPSGSTMIIAIGAAGLEVDMKYHVIPGGSAFLIPLPAKAGDRISLKAVDTTASANYFTINCFG